MENCSIGTFAYQFNTLGTYYYWSGDVTRTPTLRGVVNVNGSAVDKTASISLNLAGYSGISN
jgi:hypothetical protein